jgi:2-oxoglutarate/2-oxoacid ferredoxin oxidoreductase subunit alpha
MLTITTTKTDDNTCFSQWSDMRPQMVALELMRFYCANYYLCRGGVGMQDCGWKVGGKQGEGIDSTGDIYAIALHRMGYYVFTYRHFMSLIKGGHTNYKIRVADELVRHHGDLVHVLIAFDQKTIDENWRELADGAVVVYDGASFEATIPEHLNVHLCQVPLTEIAKQAGGAIMKNMVSIGVTAAVHEMDPELFHSVIEDKFGKKGAKVVEANLKAVREGFNYYQEHYNAHIPMPKPTSKPSADNHFYVSGNQAAGFGALAGGCRFLAAYPITPATEIMYWMIAEMPKHGGIVVQAEDEIAAVNMAIGANFAGVPAMTSTSGPGFSLMMEALGLAGMSETPLVIVDVQRSGPSTGLPTKTEQSDLNEALYGTHGEIQRIVLTPRTVEECFGHTADAFHLAEKYQMPVIVLTDLYMGMSSQSIDRFPIDTLSNEQGKRMSDEALLALESGAFLRYDDTVSDGVSPRSVPGQKNGRFVALGNEHNGIGLEVEEQYIRQAQADKRQRKLGDFSHTSGVSVDGKTDAPFALVGFGSTYGLLEEAREQLVQSGLKVKHIHFSRVAPFPLDDFTKAMDGVERALVVELNQQGQLANVIRQQAGYHQVLFNGLKYNGDPLYVHEVLERAKQVFPMGVLQ